MRRSVNPRTCVACKRERKPIEMLRVVRTPEGDVIVDEKGRQNGRGAYVCPEPQCVALALKKNLLGRALKCAIPAAVSDRLREIVKLDESAVQLSEESALEDVKNTLGLARRAGELIIGQDRVLNELAAGHSLFVLLANDFSDNLKRSLDTRNAPARVLDSVSRLELGQLLGLRQAQIVALPTRSGFAEKLKGLLPEGGTAVE